MNFIMNNNLVKVETDNALESFAPSAGQVAKSYNLTTMG